MQIHPGLHKVCRVYGFLYNRLGYFLRPAC